MEIQKPDKPTDIRWDKPVFIRIGNGLREKVYGPAQALICLDQRWPIHHSVSFDVAKEKCNSTMNGVEAADEAREAFSAAAAEARILST